MPKLIFLFRTFVVVIALTLILSSNAAAEQSAFAEQDAREREAALTFAKGRGLDLSKAVESETGLWSLVVDEGQGPLASSTNTTQRIRPNPTVQLVVIRAAISWFRWWRSKRPVAA